MRIKQLSATVANQIAAGEVIERPASVVKELLENTLDANADSISIEIGFGGLNQIKISDNGCGIVADDLTLAVSAHATSKICKLNDLATITSMGFRGEALASIASVSRLSISSRPKEQEHAMMLQENGVISLCARGYGTTVDVRDIFYNAPVRRRFLKSERCEFMAIEAVIKRFALAEPAMAISLKHNDKQLLSLPSARCEKTKLLRIKKLLGKNFVEQAIYLDKTKGFISIEGWVSSPDYQRSQNDKVWVYLNQRMVKDKLIYHAIKQAYEGYLYPGRFPSCIIYLTMPAIEVDVNVHPTKHEVRFQQPRLVHDFVVSEIREALSSQINNSSGDLGFAQDSVVPAPLAVAERFVQETFLSREPLQPRLNSTYNSNYSSLRVSSSSTCKNSKPAVIGYQCLVLNSQFIILKNITDCFIVDAVLALQEQLKLLLQSALRPLPSRPLLVPVRYSLTTQLKKLLSEIAPILVNLGVKFELGIDDVKICSIPICLPQLDIVKFLNKISEITDSLMPLLRDMDLCENQILDTMICSQEVDAQHLTDDEKDSIIAYIFEQIAVDEPNFLCCARLDIDKCREIVSA